ncbi:MAG: hypothetical protein JNK58_11350 [Phycisphaerae bacterium]|nr:hypothetical protein [Phycisphaerae bacterium]
MTAFDRTSHETSPRHAGAAFGRHHFESRSALTEFERSTAETKDLDDLDELASEAEVDALEQDLMAVESPEGRPPARELRDAERRVAAIVVPLVVLVPVIVIGLAAGARAAVAALIAALVLMCAAVPVWGAGLLRGSEHRRAHDEAEHIARLGERL